jgi:hypothetical protein
VCYRCHKFQFDFGPSMDSNPAALVSIILRSKDTNQESVCKTEQKKTEQKKCTPEWLKGFVFNLNMTDNTLNEKWSLHHQKEIEALADTLNEQWSVYHRKAIDALNLGWTLHCQEAEEELLTDLFYEEVILEFGDQEERYKNFNQFTIKRLSRENQMHLKRNAFKLWASILDTEKSSDPDKETQMTIKHNVFRAWSSEKDGNWFKNVILDAEVEKEDLIHKLQVANKENQDLIHKLLVVNKQNQTLQEEMNLLEACVVKIANSMPSFFQAMATDLLNWRQGGHLPNRSV